MKTRWKKLYTLFCVCLTIMLFPISALAAPEDEASISLTLKYPLSGVHFYLYKVADFSETGVFDLVAPFDTYANEIENLDKVENAPEEMTTESWRKLATTLKKYVIDERADIIGRTDKDGIWAQENIEKGLYLILGESAEVNEQLYTPSPVLTTIPNRDEQGAWNNQAVLDYNGKVAVDDIYDEYIVEKIWKDDGNESKRPQQIIVELYMDLEAEAYDSVILNEDNDWEYTWSELPTGHKWSVAEKEVPDNYKVNYVVERNRLVIENTYDGPDTPSQPTLPQTGQLWWPVPILAILGIGLFAIGWARRNSGER